MPEARNISILRTKNGGYLTAAHENILIVEAHPFDDCVFEITEISDDRVTLKPLLNNRVVGVVNGELCLALPGPEIMTEFTMKQSPNGSVSFKTPDGKQIRAVGYSLQAVESDVTSDEDFFTMEKDAIVDDPNSIMWETKLHDMTLTDACELVRMFQKDIPNAPAFLSFIAKYDKEARQGNYDADYKSPFRDDYFCKGLNLSIYRNHFYDPATNESIFPKYPGFHALNMCLDFLETAVNYNDPEKKAYNFGLAFHFACDLTMPMHTALFTNGLLDRRHSSYEKRADEWYEKKREILKEEMKKVEFASIRSLMEMKLYKALYVIASASKGIYNSYVYPNMPPIGRNDWTPEQMEPSMKELFIQGHYYTRRHCFVQASAAAFIAHFAAANRW